MIDLARQGLRIGDEIRIRVDIRGRRNDLHPPQDCAQVDSTEAVLHYVAPDVAPDGRRVRALRVSTVACGTQYDTVVSVRNECSPEATDYVCNNDSHLDDGRMSHRSVAHFIDVEPAQHVYIVVDGFDGSAGQAEVVVTEIAATSPRARAPTRARSAQ